jgi:capsule polysaccharide export protein KpsE/RkpR
MTAGGASQAGAALPYLVAVIAAGGGLGGIAALVRSRPESGKILIDAAQGAVIVQSAVLGQLKAELAVAQEQIAQLRADMGELAPLRTNVRALEHDNEMLRSENARLGERVRQLEASFPRNPEAP